MAVVFGAVDDSLERTVVIKFPTPPANPARQEEWLRRFHREARAQARINHPNVCTIHDVGEDSTFGPYIVMEHIAGESLGDRIARLGQISARTAVEIATAVASALQAAHREGVTHRDLTHNNVMYSVSGFVKVLDFGLALLKDDPLRVTDPPRPGIGTYLFMAPEQRATGDVDPRCDIFSLGVLLFWMLSGRPPVTFASPIPIRSLHQCRDLPQILETVLTRMLQLDPSARYQTSTELLGALQDVTKVIDGFSRQYSYFDASALLDVVCDPQPASDFARTRAANARLALRIEFEQDRAVASSAVIQQLVEEIARLYFEDSDHQFSDEVRNFVRAKRRGMAMDLGMSESSLTWQRVTIDRRRAFAVSVSPFFIDNLNLNHAHGEASECRPRSVDAFRS